MSHLSEGSFLSQTYLGGATTLTDLSPQHSGGNIVGSVPAVFPNDQSIGSPVGEDVYLPGGIIIRRKTLIMMAVAISALVAAYLVLRRKD